ncbi:MAG: hypothetical protein AAF467_01750 [Actinomycetota bacterium]
MTDTHTAAVQPGPGPSVHTTRVLPWPILAPAVPLIAIYTMLSYLAFGNQSFFYDSMDIPTPANEFLLWSWGGKNTAVLLGLVIATLTRFRFAMLASIAMLVLMQMGDVNAGAQSGTNVFVTWIAFGITMVQLALITLDWRRNG